MLLLSRGSTHDNFSAEDLRIGLFSALDKLGKKNKIIVLPPDYTRFHSHAGELTCYAFDYYQNKLQSESDPPREIGSICVPLVDHILSLSLRGVLLRRIPQVSDLACRPAFGRPTQ